MLWVCSTSISDQTETIILRWIWRSLSAIMPVYSIVSKRNVFFRQKTLVDLEVRNLTAKRNTWKYNWISSDRNLGPYDKNSIMHYDGKVRNIFKHPIIKDKLTGNGIEVNKVMSQFDIQKINEMYPCKPSGPFLGMIFPWRHTGTYMFLDSID